MDSLKFAFDTLIIGALALPWLFLFMRIFFQRSDNQKDIKFPIIEGLPDSTKELVGGVLILALGYFLGSAVSRISSDFFDDQEILLGLPTQTSIRQGVYVHEYCDEHGVLIATKLPAELAALTGGRAGFCQEPAKELEELITEFFGLQEGRLLLVGEDKLARLREFHDQIEILRGATFNGGLLFILSWFGLCALYRERASPGKRQVWLRLVSYAPALAFLFFGLWTMEQHFYRLGRPEVSAATAAPAGVRQPAATNSPRSNAYEGHRDPPLAEMVMILLGIGGLLLRPTGDNPRLYRNVCLIAAVLTLTAYGSWWWTEVIYDEHVIHSVEK